MKKFFKVLLFASAGTIFIFLFVFIFIWFSQDKIKQFAVQQLNEQLLAPISVKSIDITFLQQFPRVSLLFNDIAIADPISKKQSLFEARRLFVAFNIYDILVGRYNIKTIEADSGDCFVFINGKNESNYFILKPSTANKKDLFLTLKSIRLNNIRIQYQNITTKQFYDLDALKMVLTGDFKGKKESITAKGNIYVKKLRTGGLILLNKKNLDINLALQIDESQFRYTIVKGDISVGSLALTAIGNITNKPQSMGFDIQFSAKKIAIVDLLNLLPSNLSNQISEYESSGIIYFGGKIEGEYGPKKTPSFSVNFGIANGKLKAPKTQMALENMQCKGEFANTKNGDKQDPFLKLSELSFTLGKGSFEGSLNVTQFANPSIQIKLKGNTTISDLLAFTQNETIEKANGKLFFDIAMEGNLKELRTKSGFANSNSSGSIECEATEIVLKNSDKKIINLSTRLVLVKKDLQIAYFNAMIDKSDITITGYLLNALPYLLTDKQVLTASVFCSSNVLNLQRLPLATAISKENQVPFSLPNNIIVKANLDLNSIQFDKFFATNIKGEIDWQQKIITTNNLTCQTMGGSVALKGQLENTADGKFMITSIIVCKNININELFKQCNNFGQVELTDQQLSGVLTSNMDILGVWNNNLECDLDKLYMIGKIEISNGQLQNYKPLESLSRFVNIDDLRNIKFANLSNTIEIKKRMIFIPSMEVKNNALDLSIAGTHTFNNVVDYQIKIKLGDLLAKKYRQRPSEFEEENLDKGSFLYLSMKGPVDKLQFSYDKKQARKKVMDDLKNEKETLKNVLRKELGIEKDNGIKEKNNNNDELEFEAE